MKPQTAEMTARRIASAPEHYAGMLADWQTSRFAVVRNADSVRQVEAYLPGNYALMESFTDENGKLIVIIGGNDRAGWTLDGYVVPRLASGLIWAEEIGNV